MSRCNCRSSAIGGFWPENVPGRPGRDRGAASLEAAGGGRPRPRRSPAPPAVGWLTSRSAFFAWPQQFHSGKMDCLPPARTGGRAARFSSGGTTVMPPDRVFLLAVRVGRIWEMITQALCLRTSSAAIRPVVRLPRFGNLPPGSVPPPRWASRCRASCGMQCRQQRPPVTGQAPGEKRWAGWLDGPSSPRSNRKPAGTVAVIVLW